MTPGLVSIVMPTFNGTRYLDEAIASCLAQTHDRWELVIVDDASTDDAASALARWAARDERIRVITHDTNRGLPASLNTGVDAMTGEFFTWLSDDDRFRPQALSTMVAFLDGDPAVDVVYTDYSEVSADGGFIRRIEVGDADLLGVANPTGVCHLRRTTVFDRVGRYAEDLFLAEDLDMWIRMHAHCELRPLHEDLFEYRQHDGSLTTRQQKRVYPVHEAILDRHRDTMTWLDADGMAWAYIRLARVALRHRDREAVLRLGRKSLANSPTFPIRKSIDRLLARLAGEVGEPVAPDGDELACPSLLWVYTEDPEATLDAATWIDTSRELTDLGWDVTLAAVGDGGRRTIRGAPVRFTRRPDTYLVGQALFHLRIAAHLLRRRRGVDVVLFHEMSSIWLLPAALLLRVLPGPRPRFVMDSRTLHMTAPDNQGAKDRLRRWYYAAVNRSADTWTDGRVTITDRMAEALAIPADRLLGVWPSGVVPQPFADAAVGRTHPAPGERIRLVYVGSLAHERNVFGLAEAVDLAVAESLPFHLTVVGSGSGAEELAAFAESRPHIELVGSVRHDEIPALLAEAHVGVLPFPDELKFRVSSPIKLFEYLASGLSILATRIACHTDVIDDDEIVVWIEGAEPAAILEALRTLAKRSDDLAQAGAAALARSADWSWRRSAEKLAAALEPGGRS